MTMILEIDANSKGDPNNHINQKNHSSDKGIQNYDLNDEMKIMISHENHINQKNHSSDKRIQNYDLNDKMKTMIRHENHTNHTNQKNHSSDKY